MKPIRYFRASKHNLDILKSVSNQSEFIRDAIDFLWQYGFKLEDHLCKKKHTECKSPPGYCKNNPLSLANTGKKVTAETIKIVDTMDCPYRKARIKAWYSEEHFNRRLNKIFEPYEIYSKEDLDLLIHPPE